MIFTYLKKPRCFPFKVCIDYVICLLENLYKLVDWSLHRGFSKHLWLEIFYNLAYTESTDYSQCCLKKCTILNLIQVQITVYQLIPKVMKPFKKSIKCFVYSRAWVTTHNMLYWTSPFVWWGRSLSISRWSVWYNKIHRLRGENDLDNVLVFIFGTFWHDFCLVFVLLISFVSCILWLQHGLFSGLGWSLKFYSALQKWGLY